MILDVVRTMYRYNAWANVRILDTAAALTHEQLAAPGGASFDSVRDTLIHVVNGQWLYLERWQGRSPRAWPEPAPADLATIRARWERVEADTRTFLGALTEARAAAVVEYVNMEGQRWAYPLWQQLLHQVNHATQHRSEIAMVLTRLGHSPGWLDVLYFIDLEKAGQA
ncbi:MAG TPA: DinB family protein [Methylomirabilota bacterium]|nr:DinB family protein [Methylomirabilota bacterium]